VAHPSGAAGRRSSPKPFSFTSVASISIPSFHLQSTRKLDAPRIPGACDVHASAFDIEYQRRVTFTRQPHAFTRQPHAFTRQPHAFTRQPHAFTRQPHAFTRQPHALTRQPHAFTRQPHATASLESLLLSLVQSLPPPPCCLSGRSCSCTTPFRSTLGSRCGDPPSEELHAPLEAAQAPGTPSSPAPQARATPEIRERNAMCVVSSRMIAKNGR
jgi:hypothetical protein